MKNKGTFATVFSFAERCRGKMILSVTFAVLSVTGGLLPYLGIYKIILFSLKELLRLKILFRGSYCVSQVMLQSCFFTVSPPAYPYLRLPYP